MKKFSVKKLALAGMFCALCVVGSVFSFPMFGSKCAPVQHMVNVLCAVLLGPWWGVGVAFVASLLRNILGLGSLMAFPGSMFGALLCGLVYAKTKNLIATLVGEVFGTSILGGLCAYPVAICLMGKSAGDIAFYAYIVPFLVSTAGGAVIAGVLLAALQLGGSEAPRQRQQRFQLRGLARIHPAGDEALAAQGLQFRSVAAQHRQGNVLQKLSGNFLPVRGGAHAHGVKDHGQTQLSGLAPRQEQGVAGSGPPPP